MALNGDSQHRGTPGRPQRVSISTTSKVRAAGRRSSVVGWWTVIRWGSTPTRPSRAVSAGAPDDAGIMGEQSYNPRSDLTWCRSPVETAPATGSATGVVW